MKKQFFSALCAATMLPLSALAHDAYDSRIDNHAPIGVMADHFHKKREFMASLRGMYMDMGSPINPMMGPQSMQMKMGMLGMMYAPSNSLTLMGMLNYVDNDMDMTMMGASKEMGTSDIGDLTLSAMVPVVHGEDRRFHVTLGASIPLGSTGSTTATGNRMALTMQTGTGSWGLKPSVTYTQFLSGWSFGLQANGQFWLDDNDLGERMGDSFELTGWTAVPVSKHISLSARSSYTERGAVSGSMIRNVTDERKVWWAYAGVNTELGGHRFAIELGHPLWQGRNTNALDLGVTLTVGWQKPF